MSSKTRDSVADYIQSEEKQRQLYKRTIIVIIISQIFGGAGLAAGVSVGALLAQDMIGTDSFAGIPAALITLGSAVAAYTVGRLSQRFGRRNGLATGFATGGIGSAGIVLAAVMNSLPLLFISLFIYGAGTASNLQARYAGTDLAKPHQRAKAVSMAMVFTTIGAVAGPNLVEPMSNFAEGLGLPPLTGPFLLSGAAFLTAGAALFIMLRPDPLLVADAIAAAKQKKSASGQQSKALQSKTNAKLGISGNNQQGVIIGATVMILTQIVMVAVMTMTPVHMIHHGHELSDVGIVIGIHVAAMYLPSLITGVLVDKLGRTTMSITAGITLLASGLLAAYAPGDSMLWLTVALALLGLGWNFGLISGTAQVVDSTEPGSRAKTQGKIDVLVAIAGASGGALSGTIVASTSFTVLSLLGGALSLLLVPVILWTRKKPAMASSSSVNSEL